MDKEKKVKFNMTVKPSDIKYWEEVAQKYNLSSISTAVAFITNDFKKRQELIEKGTLR